MTLEIIRTMYNKQLNATFKRAILVLFQSTERDTNRGNISNANFNGLEMTLK